MGILTVNSDLEKLFGNRNNYFTIEAITSGKISFNINNGWDKELYCAKNNQEWGLLKYNGENYKKEFSLEVGDKLYFKCYYNRPISFNSIADIDVQNFNIMGYLSSLWKGDNCVNDNTLSGMYCLGGCFTETGVVNANKLILPTNTEQGCYSNMFQLCTSLTTAPELPATELAPWCYSQMFASCTSLAKAPELPATTLTDSCYNGMFTWCSNLNYIKMLATNISANGCLNGWASKVASTGTFVKNSAATWNVTGVSGIPEGWTVETL